MMGEYFVPKYTFKYLKHDPEVQKGLSIFRLWQKEHSGTQEMHCHLYFGEGVLHLSPEGISILENHIPILSLYWLWTQLTDRPEQEFEAAPELDLITNDTLLENIVSSIFVDDTDAVELDDGSAPTSPADSYSLNIDDDRLLSQTDLHNYPIKLTQQQLLLLNSLSNRLTLLYNDVEKSGVPLHVLQPHKAALQRMIAASREIQFKVQSFARKHRTIDSATVTPDSSVVADAQSVEREQEKLRNQLDALNEKLTFFSSEYQRITELYMQERNRKQTDSVEELYRAQMICNL